MKVYLAKMLRRWADLIAPLPAPRIPVFRLEIQETPDDPETRVRVTLTAGGCGSVHLYKGAEERHGRYGIQEGDVIRYELKREDPQA